MAEESCEEGKWSQEGGGQAVALGESAGSLTLCQQWDWREPVALRYIFEASLTRPGDRLDEEIMVKKQTEFHFWGIRGLEFTEMWQTGVYADVQKKMKISSFHMLQLICTWMLIVSVFMLASPA